MLKSAAVLLCVVFIFSTQACTQHKVEVAPVEVKPIHITIDVNIKVDKALDDFFGDIDEDEETADETPAVKK
jgi:Skp family chaperone for outer membrane proteins